LTWSATFVCACGPPVCAVTLRVDRPVGVPALTVIVMVELFGLPGETVIVEGLRLTVAPLGQPLALRVTLPTNPLDAVTVMVDLPDGLFERLTVTVAGLAVTEIEPPKFTFSENGIEWVRLPLVPVICKG